MCECPSSPAPFAKEKRCSGGDSRVYLTNGKRKLQSVAVMLEKPRVAIDGGNHEI